MRGVNETPTPTQVEAPVHIAHPRVIEQIDDSGRAIVTILPPRNPLQLHNWAALLFPAVALAFAIGLIVEPFVALRPAGASVGMFSLIFLAMMLAWFAAELPDLMRGFHTRVEFAIDPDELRATMRFPWAARTSVYRREQVRGVREVWTSWRTRALRVRFKDAASFEVMLGYPDDHIDAAVAALRTALAAVAPRTPVLHADGVATLPYAGAGRSYEVEVERFAAGGVSVRVPPTPRSSARSLGSVLFTAMWVTMFASMLARGWGRMGWCPLLPLLVLGGTWGLAVAIRDYIRRNEPTLLALTPSELLIENGPWFRRTRRIPRGEIKSIAMGASGRHRRMVLAITRTRGRPLELMEDREVDEIQRAAEALSEAFAGKRERDSCTPG